MSIKIRLATYATTAAIIAAVGLFYAARDSDDNYLLSVKWVPEVLSIQNPVYITATVDGVPLIRRTRHVSPWGETMTAVPMAQVTLSAVTRHPGIGFLDCIIMVNGRSVPHTGHDSITGPGKVTCTN